MKVQGSFTNGLVKQLPCIESAEYRLRCRNSVSTVKKVSNGLGMDVSHGRCDFYISDPGNVGLDGDAGEELALIAVIPYASK